MVFNKPIYKKNAFCFCCKDFNNSVDYDEHFVKFVEDKKLTCCKIADNDIYCHDELYTITPDPQYICLFHYYDIYCKSKRLCYKILENK